MAAPNEQSEAPSTAPAAMTTERELLREALEGIDDHWITLPEGVAWKKKVNALLALPATQRSGLPDAWLEIDHGQVIGVSIEKDLRSPFKWVPLYAAPISEKRQSFGDWWRESPISKRWALRRAAPI